MFRKLMRLLFPPKCLLCGRLLSPEEKDLCTDCRAAPPICQKSPSKAHFVEKQTVMWYYTDTVRRCILRYKFYGRRAYCRSLGCLLAARLTEEYPEGLPVLTWVPISRRRRITRGYDQTELLAKQVAKTLGIPAVSTLVKIRHSRPQSSLRDPAARRANVLGAFKVKNREALTGKTLLLLDDIITTGATVSECAKTLLTAGAKEVHCAALAAPYPKK